VRFVAAPLFLVACACPASARNDARAVPLGRVARTGPDLWFPSPKLLTTARGLADACVQVALLPDPARRTRGRANPWLAPDLERSPSFAQGIGTVNDHHQLGQSLPAVGDGPAAVESFRAALERDPTLAPARAGLGDALLALGDWAAAAEAYRRALRDEDLATAHRVSAISWPSRRDGLRTRSPSIDAPSSWSSSPKRFPRHERTDRDPALRDLSCAPSDQPAVRPTGMPASARRRLTGRVR
jgi:hypothetical protein